jgi:uncharacterized protein (TIGR02268 family)
MEARIPKDAKARAELTRRMLLLPVLGGLAASAAPPAPRRLGRRSLYLSLDPGEKVPEILVWARTVTTLRFESPVDARRTKLEGGEARFEPLVIGDRSLSLYPLSELAPEDRFRLTVALTDGALLPFTLRSDPEQVDGQVDVYPDPDSCEALRAQLRELQEDAQRRSAELQRRMKEELSVNHALATLLVTGAAGLTRLLEGKKRRFRTEGVQGYAQFYTGLERSAVLLTVTNLDPRFPWRVAEVRLMSEVTLRQKPFALRMEMDGLSPGATGRIAIVVSSGPQGTVQPHLLEIFREDGYRDVALDKLMF